MRKITRYILTLAALTCSLLHTSAQDFYNLTSDQVRIDSQLPYFAQSMPLKGDFADSVYTIEIQYPEFIDMSEGDIRRLRLLTGEEQLPSLPKVESYIGVERRKGLLCFGFVPLVERDGKLQKLVSFKLVVKAKAKETAAESTETAAELTETASQSVKTAAQSKKYAARAGASGTSAASRYAANSVLRSGRWAKIRVPSSGYYQLTSDLVRRAGFSDVSKVKIYGYGGALVPERLTGSYLAEYDDLKQVPTCTVNGQRVFYAQGPVSWDGNLRVRNPYSDYGYYFLTENDEQLLTQTAEEMAAANYPVGDDYNTLYEVDDFAWFSGGRNLFDAQPISAGQSRSYSLSAANGSCTSGTLTVSLSAGVSEGSSCTGTIFFNGTRLGTMTIKGEANADSRMATQRFTVSNIQAENTVTLQRDNNESIIMRLDYLSLYCNTPRGLRDLSSMAFATPEYVNNITNQDLHSHATADMIIIIPTNQKLRSHAERLKAFHEQNDQMTVRIVPADELYNEFSSGTPDASAYRRYLKMLYDREADVDKAPRYVILFGDCAWDNRKRLQEWSTYSPDDFLLAYESENSCSKVECFVSDDFICLLDDEEMIEQRTTPTSSALYLGKMDLSVGRFPVRTDAQAKAMVDKTIAYSTNAYAGDWQNTVVFMGDDGNKNLHMTQTEALAAMVEREHPALNVKRIMWDAYTLTQSSTGNSYPDVTRLITQYMNSGALLMNYTGHGAPYTVSHERVVSVKDFENSVTNHYPVWMTASCDLMPFDGQEENIGETAVFNPKGGAVAFYGTTRTVLAENNRVMNLAFTSNVLNSENTLGDAIRLTKNYLVTSTASGRTYPDATANKLQFSLLGDPALHLAVPKPRIVIDSINGVSMTGTNSVMLKAGQIVSVKGHVQADGAVDASFNGQMTATVRDVKEKIVCKNNSTAEADEAFVFYNRQSTLFNGSNNVKAGLFDFSFAVPKDISYTSSSGQLLVYAINNEKTQAVNGSTEQFVLNGSEGLDRDTIGPSIYCYLNSSSFANGGSVNSTPYFVAELSDEDGINASGSGIGHDLLLIIDGNIEQTYVLNDNFIFDFGSYQRGTLGYSIPQLSAGEHKLLFRAWDVLNNSSTAELTFNVVKGLEPTLFDVECTKSPATTSTSFRVIHDRIGSQMDLILDIFDISGRHLWSYSESGTATDNTYTIDWDLTVDGGRRLGTGIYLYRVRMSCEGSSYASKAKKMVILSNK